MPLARDERETIIRRTEVDSNWDIWCDPGPFRRMLERKGYRHTAEGVGFYQIPLNRVRISASSAKKRVLTAEHKAKLAARGFGRRKQSVEENSAGVAK